MKVARWHTPPPLEWYKPIQDPLPTWTYEDALACIADPSQPAVPQLRAHGQDRAKAFLEQRIARLAPRICAVLPQANATQKFIEQEATWQDIEDLVHTMIRHTRGDPWFVHFYTMAPAPALGKLGPDTRGNSASAWAMEHTFKHTMSSDVCVQGGPPVVDVRYWGLYTEYDNTLAVEMGRRNAVEVLDEFWICCGRPKDHPGCWKGDPRVQIDELPVFDGEKLNAIWLVLEKEMRAAADRKDVQWFNQRWPTVKVVAVVPREKEQTVLSPSPSLTVPREKEQTVLFPSPRQKKPTVVSPSPSVAVPREKEIPSTAPPAPKLLPQDRLATDEELNQFAPVVGNQEYIAFAKFAPYYTAIVAQGCLNVILKPPKRVSLIDNLIADFKKFQQGYELNRKHNLLQSSNGDSEMDAFLKLPFSSSEEFSEDLKTYFSTRNLLELLKARESILKKAGCPLKLIVFCDETISNIQKITNDENIHFTSLDKDMNEHLTGIYEKIMLRTYENKIGNCIFCSDGIFAEIEKSAVTECFISTNNAPIEWRETRAWNTGDHNRQWRESNLTTIVFPAVAATEPKLVNIRTSIVRHYSERIVAFLKFVKEIAMERSGTRNDPRYAEARKELSDFLDKQPILDKDV